MSFDKTLCKNYENCPWCAIEEGKEKCENQLLREVQSLYHPMTYWIRKETDESGVEGYILTIFHGRPMKMFSDAWLTTDLKKLKPIIKYLEEKKVERGDDSIIVEDALYP